MPFAEHREVKLCCSLDRLKASGSLLNRGLRCDMETLGMNDNEREFYQHYYLMQNQRQGQHETKSLTVSNFVLAGSLVGLGLIIGEEKIQPLHLLSILALIAIVNLMAWIYIKRSRYWVRVHQERATWALARLSPNLLKMQAALDAESPKKLMKNNFHALGLESDTRTLKELIKATQGRVGFFHLTRPEHIQGGFHLAIVVILLATILWDHFY
jgi:hypothetical protein